MERIISMLNKNHVKTNGLAFIFLIVAFVTMSFWLLPAQKQSDKTVNNNYVEMAQLYNDSTQTYTDVEKVQQLKDQNLDIKIEGVVYNLIRVAIISLILTTLIGLLGNYLQYIYTDLKFTDVEDSPAVLAAALVCTTIVVCTVYILYFLPTAL